MTKANKFQIVKVQPQGVAQFLLDFLPICHNRQTNVHVPVKQVEVVEKS